VVFVQIEEHIADQGDQEKRNKRRVRLGMYRDIGEAGTVVETWWGSGKEDWVKKTISTGSNLWKHSREGLSRVT
jgi:hypothetical protein